MGAIPLTFLTMTLARLVIKFNFYFHLTYKITYSAQLHNNKNLNGLTGRSYFTFITLIVDTTSVTSATHESHSSHLHGQDAMFSIPPMMQQPHPLICHLDALPYERIQQSRSRKVKEIFPIQQPCFLSVVFIITRVYVRSWISSTIPSVRGIERK